MRFIKIAIISLIGIILILPNSVLGATLLIQPSNADAELNQANPDTNFGLDTIVRIASWSGNNDRGIFRFDFSALPDNATITSATILSLFYNAGIDCVGRTNWVYELTQTEWVETEATWNSYKTGSTWTTAGGDFITTNGVSALVPATTGNWIEFNVLDLIQHFQANHNEIANILIKDGTEDNPTNASCYFRSNNYSTLELTPKLEITYTTPIVCGNDIKEAGEVCDGIDLDGETCVSQGFEGGTLACAVGCGSFDTSSCHYIPAGAGNILPIGTDFPVSALAYVGELFGDIYPYIGVLVGIPLAFWIIGSVIDTAKKKKKGRKFN